MRPDMTRFRGSRDERSVNKVGYRYLRFRVKFELSPGHQDGDPVPIVREIRVPVSATSD